MKNRLRNGAILISLTLMISSCALFSKATEENARQIQVGQTPQEVVSIVGEPAERSPATDATDERWHYEIASSDQKAAYPYTAVFANGKLKAWYFDTARVLRGGSQQPGRGRSGSKGAPANGP